MSRIICRTVLVNVRPLDVGVLGGGGGGLDKAGSTHQRRRQKRMLLLRSSLQRTGGVVTDVNRLFHSCCIVRADHYQVLGVDRSASQKEIKEAYLKLGKELHPDRHQQNGGLDSGGSGGEVEHNHDKFVRINEAYSILSKQESKKLYDLGLDGQGGGSVRREAVYQQAGYYTQPKDFAGRAKFYGFNQDPRYVHQNSYKIAFGCVLFAVFGYIIHYQIAYMSFQSHRNSLDKIHVNLSQSVEDIKDRNRSFESKEEHFEFVKQRLLANREYHEGKISRVKAKLGVQQDSPKPDSEGETK